MKKPYIKAIVVTCFGALSISIVVANSSGTSTPYTGDFGEKSCLHCHEGNVLNSAGGALTITGVPQEYAPGQVYRLTVHLSRTGVSRWGFQLIPRIASGPNMGRPAGVLSSVDVYTECYQWESSSHLGVQVVKQTTFGSNFWIQGTWSFNWRAPSSDVGDIRFSAAAVAGNGDASAFGDYVYTTSATSRTPAYHVSAIFPHMALGGGYTTTFMLQNTGSSAASGRVVLRRDDGAALTAKVRNNAAETMTASVPVSIQSGGTQLIEAKAQHATDAVTSGWAAVESSGGSVSGIAIFQYEEAGRLLATAGVLSTGTTRYATIPVDDDDSAARYTGYALANVTPAPVTIRAFLVPENGVSGARIELKSISLAPRTQRALFVIQAPTSLPKFRGSLVLIGQDGYEFAVVALLQNRGLLTAIPVIPSKADGIE